MNEKILHINEWTRKNNPQPMRQIISKAERGIVSKMFLGNILIQETFSPRPYKLN